ncbi:hypothetical protein CsSME_00027385 [Camellia sinensis var. sinensis]
MPNTKPMLMKQTHLKPSPMAMKIKELEREIKIINKKKKKKKNKQNKKKKNKKKKKKNSETHSITAPPMAKLEQSQGSSVAADLVSFLNASPTTFHAVDAVKKRLSSAGYKQVSEREDWSLQAGKKYFFTRN